MRSISRTTTFISVIIFFSILPGLAFAANHPPSVGTITPSSGSSNPNVTVKFTTTYTDPDGWQNIQYVNLLINTSTDGANCFYGYYNQNSNKLYLRNDANTSWLGGYTPGSSNVIENSYAKLNCATTTVSGSGTTLTVKWSITFKSAFAGAKNSYLYVKDDANSYAGFTKKGTWTITNKAPSVGTITPSSGSSRPNVTVKFATTYTDPDGWLNIQYVNLLINTSTNGANCFYGYYNQNTNKLYLRNDANTSWLGGYTPGSSNVIENSYAKLNCSATTVSGSGTTLTVKWSITFKSTFTGNKNSYLYVKDDANSYAGFTKKGTWIIDGTPPIGTIVINNNAPYTNSTQVTLTLSATDDLTGVSRMKFSNDNINWSAEESYTTTKTWTLTTGDGTKKVYVKYRDGAGNWSTAFLDTIILDTTAPIGTIVINNNTAYTNLTQVTLTLSATDSLSGVSQMKFSNDNVNWSAEESYATTKTWTLTTGDGTKTVYVKYKDGAGNWSSVFSDTIILDTTAPTGTIVINNNTAYTNSTQVTLTLSATDSLSGVSQMKFSNDNVNWSVEEPYTTTKTWTLTTGDGTKTVYAKYKNGAGLWSSAVSDSIILETTPPTGTIVINSNATYTNSTQVTLTLSATDSLSGVSQMKFSNDNINWSVEESYATTKTWTLTTGDGTKTVYVKYKDGAGNWSGAFSDTIILDTTSPQIEITNPGNNSYTNQAQIDVSGPFTEINLDTIIVNGIPATVEGNTFTAEGVPLNIEGDNTITAVATDLAQNQGTHEINVIRDTIPPQNTSISIDEGEYTYNQVVNLTLSAEGAVEMLISEDPEFTGAQWEPYIHNKSFTLSEGLGLKTLYVKFRDIAGNTTSPVSSSIEILPPLEITLTPAIDNKAGHSPITVSGMVNDPRAEVTLNGIPAEIIGNIFIAQGVPLGEGENTIQAEATTSYGGSASSQMQVALDSPTIIKVPEDYSTIQEAISAANEGSGDIIKIAPGVYTGNWFTLKGGIIMEGSGANVTVIDSSGLPGSTVFIEPGWGDYSAGYTGPETIIRGFTIMGSEDGYEEIRTANCSPRIENCIIKDSCCGIGCYGITINNGAVISRPQIINNTIIDNSSFQINATKGNIEYGISEVIIKNNIIKGGVHVDTSGNPENNDISYNNVYGPGSGYIGAGIPPGTGEYAQVNENGTLCDIYGNISEDPSFTGGEQYDYHLQPTSPCIDAGDPSPEYNDPDGTRCDIGAFGGKDNIIPYIKITSPADGSLINQTQITITGIVIDENLQEVTVNEVPAIINEETFTAENVVLDTEGDNLITATALDKAGSSDSRSINIIRDTISPQTPSITIQEGEYTNNPMINLVLSAQDAVEIAISEDPLFPEPQWETYVTTKAFILSSGDDIKTIYVKYRDLAGNETEPVSDTIILDQTQPQVTITSPQDGSYTIQSQIDVSGTFTEINLDTITVNGIPATIEGDTFTAEGVPLNTEGDNPLTATITDLAHNQDTDQVNIIRDITLPHVEINSPQDGSYTNQTQIDVSGTFTEINLDTITLNGIPATIEGNTFTVQGVLLNNEGDNPITAIATDLSQNQSTHEIKVIRDTIPPEIQITTPSDNYLTNQTQINVSGTFNELNLNTITVNDIPATIEGNNFTAVGIPLNNEGNNSITATITDLAGNENSHEINVIRDTIPPQNTSITIDQGDYTNILDINLIISAEGASEMVVSEDPNFVGANWEPYAISREFSLSSGEGQKIVYAKFRDAVLNESNVVSDNIILVLEIWPMFMHDSQHTGRSPYNGQEYGDLKWNYQVDYIYSSPVIAIDGTIYIGSGDGKLYAMNSDGTLKWTYQTGDYIDSSPAIGADGTIYIGSGDGKLYAMNSDGTLKWSYQTGDYIDSSPAIGADGTIYIGSGDGKLYAINQHSFFEWSYQTGDCIYSSPAIGADGTIYIGSYDGNLYAINSDGTLKWSYQTGDYIYSSPAIGADGTIYISANISLCAINPDGILKWSYQTGDWIYSSPAIGADGTIYIGSGDGKLYAINSDGILKWSYQTGDYIYSSPAIEADGTTYIGSGDGKLYAINSDGTLKWSYQTGDWIDSSPVIGIDGTIYIGSGDGKLYAIANMPPVVSNIHASPSSISPNSDGKNDSTTITVDVDQLVNWTMAIKDSQQNIIREFLGQGSAISQVWDGKDNNNQVVPEGVYTCYINAVDPSGLAGNEVSVGITVDLTAPENPFISIDEGEFTENPNIHLTLSCDNANEMIISENSDFTGAEWELYNTSKVFTLSLNDGEKIIYAKFRDFAHNETVIVSDIITYEGPPYNTNVVINNGDYYTDTQDVVLTLFAIDAVEMIISENSELSDVEWEPYAPSKEFALSPGNSLKTVYVKFRDAEQNETVVISDIIFIAQVVWPMFRHNPEHTGRSQCIGSEYGDFKWSYKTGNWIHSSPSISVDGTIYIGANDGLYAINQTGTLKWRYGTLGEVNSPALSMDGTIYIGAYTYLYAINPNRTLKWSYQTDGWIYSSPAIGADGTIYISTYNRLYAINSDGTLKWSCQIGGWVNSSPAIGADGTIYIGSHDGKLYAINSNGTLKWSYQTGDCIYSSPAIGADGTIYVGSGDGKLYAINSDGTLKWSYQTGDWIGSSPAIDSDGTIYIGSHDGKLYAINPNGTLKWAYQMGDWTTSSPAIDSDGTIYIGSGDGKLYAINPDGTLKWSFHIGGWLDSSPVIGADGTIYISSGDGKLYAIANMPPVISNILASPPSFSPNSDGRNDTTTITAGVDQVVNWTMTIKDSQQSTIKEFSGQGSIISQVWDGKDSNSQVVPEGVYTCYTNAVDMSGLTANEISVDITVNLTVPEYPFIDIDEGEFTENPVIHLSLACDNVYEMIISEDPNFIGSQWESYKTSKIFVLSPNDEQKTVYAKFRNETSHESGIVSDTVVLDTSAPIAQITNPTEGEEIWGTIFIIGTAADPNFSSYKVEYGVGTSPNTWITIKESSEPVLDGILAAWDTVSPKLSNDTYTLRLTATDSAGKTSQFTVIVHLNNIFITNVSIEPTAFRPSLNETVGIICTINMDATVTLKLYDLNNNLIRTLLNDVIRTVGQHTEIWDGKDDSGSTVADGGYIITIEAKSGGKVGWYQSAGGYQHNAVPLGNFTYTKNFNPYNNELCIIQYTLGKNGLVLLQAGQDENHYTYKTLIDWEIRPKGSNIEYWDGRDRDGNILDYYNEEYKIILGIQTQTLPENTIVAYSDKTELVVQSDPYAIVPCYGEVTTITYSIPVDGNVTLSIHTPAGSLVKTLLDNQFIVKGTYTVIWDGSNNLGKIVSEPLNYIMKLKLVTDKQTAINGNVTVD